MYEMINRKTVMHWRKMKRNEKNKEKIEKKSGATLQGSLQAVILHYHL